MENFLSIAKQKLSQTFVNDIAEENTLGILLNESGKYRMDLLKWVMKDKKEGYISPRRQAGLEFLRKVPEEGWKILEELIISDNPDDRETAFEILCETHDSKSYSLVKILLDDAYPTLQFEACEFLLDIYPEDVKETLKELTKDNDKLVRETAEKMIDGLKKRT